MLAKRTEQYMEEDNSLIGKQIGNYRLIEEIASGSFGTVYRAQHIYLSNRVVAFKLLHMHMPVRERERFIQEAQFLENLQHRHILSLVDMGFDNGRPYLASTYAPNGSLRQRLSKTHVLPWDQVHIILTQVGEALHYAHQQNIAHCDLKPENILFNAQDEAVLADFGIATVLSTISVKQLEGAEGTPSYMAPEQFRGQISKESDQYALGCIAYELVTGQRLFSAPSFIAIGYKHETEPPTPPRQINDQIPVHVEEAILKALAKQRNDRHDDVAAFLNALQTPPPPQKTKEEWLNEGTALYNLKRYEEALSAFDQALLLDPSFAVAHNNKGLVLNDLNRYEEALLEYDQALAYSYYNKGNVLRDLKRYEEAVLAFEQALRLDPNDARAYNNKGATLYSLKLYEEALLAYDQALRLDSDNVEAYNGKGNALRHLKRYKEAVLTYDQALHLNPHFIVAYNNKGIALCDLKRYGEALSAFEQTLRIDPDNAYAYNGKGEALRHLKRYEEALLAYDQAVRLDPHFAYAHNNTGLALHDLNRYEEALLAYKQALHLDPNFAHAYNNKSLTLDRLGRSREARQARKKARELGLD